ncbi:hypothetical protein T05_15346 [Trichinella murrelli]|uniref:Uncharacterized protein n=1 Tax=Trichinella murrelli TaxID=144512 RepID=A0A0V0SVJ8_9BILA|nr:hypothetical protein T05_15346 [Trichinella murrelli]
MLSLRYGIYAIYGKLNTQNLTSAQRRHHDSNQ